MGTWPTRCYRTSASPPSSSASRSPPCSSASWCGSHSTTARWTPTGSGRCGDERAAMSSQALASLLPLPVALPLAGAVAAPLLARLHRRLAVIVGLVALGSSTAILLLQAPSVFGGLVRTHYLGLWAPVHGRALGIALAADPFGLIFALTAAVVGTVLLLYTLSELGGLGPRELGGYACLFQLVVAALIGAALTADLINLFVWFEVAALASYGLTAFLLERPIALEAAFKILALTTLASFAVFIGAGLLYAVNGALNYAQLHAALARHLSTADVIALGLLLAVGLISALLGAVMALAQDDLKRLLAYDTISQMGILAIGLGTGTAPGTAGTVYHLVNHALFKSLLFLCAGAILHRTGLTKLSEMGALARRMPAVAVAFVIGAASIAGIPPLNGYVSLSLIHTGLLDGRQYLPYALMLIAQVITIAALGKAAWLAFFRRRAQDYPPLEPLRPGMVTGLASLAACCVVFGVLPQFFLDSVMAPAAAGLRHPARYARGVLTGLARLPALHLPFDYVSPGELVSVAGCAAAGAALAWAYLRAREPGPVRLLRAAHTGSVNDYAAYAVAGMLAVIAVLTLT